MSPKNGTITVRVRGRKQTPTVTPVYTFAGNNVPFTERMLNPADVSVPDQASLEELQQIVAQIVKEMRQVRKDVDECLKSIHDNRRSTEDPPAL